MKKWLFLVATGLLASTAGVSLAASDVSTVNARSAQVTFADDQTQDPSAQSQSAAGSDAASQGDQSGADSSSTGGDQPDDSSD